MTTAEMEYQTVKTSVWWDIENCEVPRGWDAHAIAQNIGSALLKKKYSGPVSICACGDTNLIPEGVKQALSSTGVGLNHVPSGVKDASDKKILVDMLLWAKDNAAPANLMLISGDRDFSYALHQLRMRRYNILLAQPPQASVPLVAAAKDVWLWTSLASGGPPLTSAESTRLLNNGRGHVSNNEVTKHPVSEQAQSSKTTASTSDAGDAKVHKTRENHVTRGLPQESTRLLNNGRGHVSNNEVTKHPVSEQAESSKSTDTTSGAKDTKDHKTRENHIPTGLTQDSWSSEVQNGRGASGVSSVACDSFAHLSDKRPQAAFVDSNRAQASVSVRPIQEPELVECNVCQIICSSKDTYRKHTLGKRHQNNLELQSVKPKNIVEPVVLPKEVLEKEKKKVSEGAKPKADHVVSQSHIVFDSHLRGKKHASMLSQPEALIDSKPQEKGVCQGQSSKPMDSNSDAKDNKTRENYVPRGLPQETRRSMFQNGRGASGESVTACRISNVVCDSFAHLSDKRPVSQAAFVDSHRAQASASVKPIQEAELVECKVSQIICSSKDTHKKHTYRKRHQNNLELQSGKPKNIVEPVVLPKEVLEKEKKTVSERAKPNADHVVSQSQIVFDSHLRGKKHASMLSQPEALIDYSKKPQKKGVWQKYLPKETVVSQKEQLKETIAEPEPNICNAMCQSQIVFDSHLRGLKHATMLSQSEALVDSKKLQEKVVEEMDQPRETIPEPKPNTDHVFDSYLSGQQHAAMMSQSKLDHALIDSKKLQEKSAREKDQTRETIAEPKPKAEHVCRLCNVACHSQIVFDSHLRGKKHVAMLSQSEGLIVSKMLQEKGVEEKDQPREKIAELQLQSQNAQENSKCLKKHVIMVNQSEALNNSRKFEEKVSQETVAENQSQSQNTQENTNFFEKKNEEFREIHGTSESSEKELFPSTKDRVETVNKQLPNGEFFFGDLRCDFDVPREARECFDGIVKPVNLFKGATEHSGKVKKICNLANEITNLSKRRARPAASKLCNLCVVICDRQGLATVFCDDKGHWTNQKHTTAAAFVAGDDAQSSVSTKPVKEPEVLQPVWCQVCEMSCISKDTYKNHTYGKKHRQNLELQFAKNENMSRGPAKLSKENEEKKKKVLCKNQTALYSQLKSQNHAAMVKEQAEKLLVDSRRTQQESDPKKPREALEQAFFLDSRKICEESSQAKETTEEHTLVKTDDLGFQGAQEDKEEVKEINAISENLARVFTEPNRESRIPKESRGCLDVIPDGNASEKLKDESKHKPLEPENESAGLKEHPEEAAKREEEKGQVDNFWTRLWGKKR